MKKDQKKELRTKTADELVKELRDLRFEVAKLSIDMKTGKIEDTNKLYKKKKDIARIMTFLSEKPKVEVKKEAVK